MSPLIAAFVLAAPAIHTDCACSYGFYMPEIAVTALAHAQEQDQSQKQADPDTPQTKDEKRHQDDLANDVKIGKEAAAEIDKELKPSENLDQVARVKAIGAEMAEIANASTVNVMWGDPRHNTFQYEFKLVKGEDVNAFSLPGGIIYVYEGLVDFTESDDELAGVLAHEISHASFRHLDALRREQAKVDIAQIPLLIAAALAGNSNPDAMKALIAVQLVGAGLSSGWSVKAETAADYGGLQYMMKSRYSPVGCLTFMERLGYEERVAPQIDWGIYRTHPPTPERARFMIRSMNEFGIAVKRSLTTTSFSARSIPKDDGSFELWFGNYLIATYRGADAKDRGAASVLRLNAFLDTVPQMYQLGSNGDEIQGNGRTLVTLKPADLKEGESISANRDAAMATLKKVIADLQYRLWRG